ncbi:PAS domain S-box protein [Gymnodinialimonas ceratoperidinii]|uniref:histidine kinase n=1 Tax=Gymnodinialimonas ceratoperidinii TaxID=2856823 RepID=A0A8F6Y9Z3_9RHOB|nr:PAS domain S-box protein [Gymnodinialimonas ceratoperidinii]QXT39444.1 PAS domain S-box protein [Gymnodinialimonas ceratoperidinii]
MNTSDNLNEYLAAIIESSNDAIITKNLDSIIQTWNNSAERLFGYAAHEAVGRSITMLIPDDRQHEEADIIARLRSGQRIEHFETVRLRRDGTLIPISLTISPVRNRAGEVIGASKIARDITDQKQAEKQQKLLLGEMRHRVGNSFAVAGSLLAVTARQVETAAELVTIMQKRFVALASVHSLALADPMGATQARPYLKDLVAKIIEPFASGQSCTLEIDNIRIASEAVTPIALIFHELCTNATKYGAFAQSDGSIAVTTKREGDRLVIQWQERCQIAPSSLNKEGFGTHLCQTVVEATLGGTITRNFKSTGMAALIDVDLNILTDRC